MRKRVLAPARCSSLLAMLFFIVVPAEAATPEEDAVAALFERVAPAVVTVLSATETDEGLGLGVGSGVIARPDGTVLTAYHNVREVDAIRVRLKDGRTFTARLAWSDAFVDLALVRLEEPPADLAVAVLAEAPRLRVGHRLLAVGAPRGLEQTLTVGTVSALHRSISTQDGREMEHVIQTDAALNPGNSGGPLFNSSGEVVGIVNSIASPVKASSGLGFAVPVSEGQRLFAEFDRNRRAPLPWLGIEALPLTGEMARSLNLSIAGGQLIQRIVPGSPAAKAKLRGGTILADFGGVPVRLGGDIIVEFNSADACDPSCIYRELGLRMPGDIVPVKVLREGRPVMVHVRLESRGDLP